MPNNETKRIVITGVTRGLGRAMADRFIAEGHQVAGCGSSATRITEFRKRHDPADAWQTVNVADADAVQAWADDVAAMMGPPNLLINNAAMMNKNAHLWDVPADEFSDVIDVNIKGVYHVIRAFAPAMIKGGSGVIVNFSSGWGRSTSPEVAPYCATKWAIEGMTKAMAQELPAGLAAVALNPGIINTDMLKSCFGEGAASYPTAEQWARTAVPFLLQLGAGDNGKSLSVG